MPYEERDTEGEHHVTVETGMGAKLLQIQDWQLLLETEKLRVDSTLVSEKRSPPTFSLQSCEGIRACCFKSPSLWPFVTAALGDSTNSINVPRDLSFRIFASEHSKKATWKKKIKKAWLGKVSSKEKRKKTNHTAPFLKLCDQTGLNIFEVTCDGLIFPSSSTQVREILRKRRYFDYSESLHCHPLEVHLKKAFYQRMTKWRPSLHLTQMTIPLKARELHQISKIFKHFWGNQCHLNKIVFVALEVGGTCFILKNI